MRPEQLLESLAIGISIAAVPGPVLLELTRRTLSFGFLSGVALALGEFIGNLLLLSVAFFGLAGAMGSAAVRPFLAVAGAAILVRLGLLAWRGAGPLPRRRHGAPGWRASVLTGFGMALLSPVTVALWVALSGSYLSRFGAPPDAIPHILLIASGFLAFFIPFAAFLAHFRSAPSPACSARLSKALGATLIAFGALTAARLLALPPPLH